MGRYFCDNCYVFRCYSLYLPVEVVFCVFICEHGPNQSHQQVLTIAFRLPLGANSKAMAIARTTYCLLNMVSADG
jgi:hypothetical protein